jgi:type IV pilus assembly protein PilQ
MTYRYDQKFVLFLFVLITGMLVACASQQQNDTEPDAFDLWKARAQESRGYSPASRARSLELHEKKIETFGADLSDTKKKIKPLPTRPITMKMHQAEAAVLLRALARSVQLNLMINENMGGKISIDVRDTPWDQVFMGILKSQGLSYEWEGDILRIVTFADRERSLKHLEAEQKILEKQRALQMNAPFITKIIPIDYAKADQLKSTLETLLGQVQKDQYNGAIMVDAHTNSLIVQATPADIQRIIPLIIELDRPIPQIHIEAHIVEASSSTARDLGVQWGGMFYDANRNSWIVADAIGAVDNVFPGSGDTVNPSGGAVFNFPADIGALGMSLGLVSQGDNGLLALQLTALEREGKLNILSSPSITTVDNRKALIESGSEAPIQTVDYQGNVKIEYKKAVLSLEVTPHVIQNNALILNIATTKDELDFANEVNGNPTITTKKATTNVVLFDGQTTVIGGLKKDSKQEGEQGVPWLSKVPILGYLFKNESRTESLEELLIFITPHILETRHTQSVDEQ